MGTREVVHLCNHSCVFHFHCYVVSLVYGVCVVCVDKYIYVYACTYTCMYIV